MRIAQIIPNKKINYQQNLRATTWRGFNQGWNTLDDDLSLSFRYATVLDNCYADSNGVIRVRQGFRFFADCSGYLTSPGHIVDIIYFNESLVAVASNGEIFRILGDGSVVRIWDATIAAALPDAPTGWSELTFVSFAIFNGRLIIANGIDKPLYVDTDFAVEYLQDLGTSTNINVPICKYVTSVGRYLVMAGDPLEPDRVHISAKDAPGTWYGDPPPNDATRLDVGGVIPSATVIRGLLPFRGKLVVMFAEGLVFGELGSYDADGNHTPSFEDGVEGYGSISHRAGITYGDDALFMDLEGVPSIKRTVLSQSFKPERMSELIDSNIKVMLSQLSFEALEDRIFSVYNKVEGQYMLFVPNNESLDDTDETVAFVFHYHPTENIQNWSRYRGMNFTCATRSLESRLFFADKNNIIWLFGNRDDPIDLDYYDGTTGQDINFVWEWPWFDLGDRSKTKTSKYIAFDTRGASQFSFEMYTDNFTAVPALAIEFSGGEQGDFGDGTVPLTRPRPTADKHLYSWPTKFEIAKFRISGKANAQLAFVSVTLHYLVGGINR